MTIHKTAGLAAVAALALPAGAAAHGKGPHHKQPQCGKLVGFSATGTGLDASGFTFADGQGNGTLKLDVTRANKPARTFLGITSLPAAGESITLTNDALRLRFRGVNGLTDVKPTDRVRISGRVTKARPNCAAGTPTLDVRKITVNRPGTDQSASSSEPDQSQKAAHPAKPSHPSNASQASHASHGTDD